MTNAKSLKSWEALERVAGANGWQVSTETRRGSYQGRAVVSTLVRFRRPTGDRMVAQYLDGKAKTAYHWPERADRIVFPTRISFPDLKARLKEPWPSAESQDAPR